MSETKPLNGVGPIQTHVTYVTAIFLMMHV